VHRVWLIGSGNIAGVICGVWARCHRVDDGLRRRWRIRRLVSDRCDRSDLPLFAFETKTHQTPIIDLGCKHGTSMCCIIHCRQAICQHPTVTASKTIGSAAQIGHSPPCSPSICPNTSRPYFPNTSSSCSPPPSRNRASNSSSDTSSPSPSCAAAISGSVAGSRSLTREGWQQDWRRRSSMDRIVV